MASRVVFVDTSVLLNVLQVPGTGNAVDHHADRQQFAELVEEDDVQLVLPLTAIIETGNTISGLDGDKRRFVKQYVEFLHSTLTGAAPWVAAGFDSTTALLQEMLVDAQPVLPDLMTAKVGTGDAAILAEVAEMRRRLPSGMPITIWTRDQGLRAYSQ